MIISQGRCCVNENWRITPENQGKSLARPEGFESPGFFNGLTLPPQIYILYSARKGPMTIQCPKCKTDNLADSKYCKECATPLSSFEDAKSSFTKTLETPVEEIKRGTLFADRYEIIEELGIGE